MERKPSLTVYNARDIVIDLILNAEPFKSYRNDVAAMYNRHAELSKKARSQSLYHNALLHKDCPKPLPYPVFANAPMWDYGWVDENLELIFDTLKIPTTQGMLYRIAKATLPPAGTTDIWSRLRRFNWEEGDAPILAPTAIRERLEALEFCTKRKTWLDAAKQVLDVMEKNRLMLEQPGQEEAMEFSKLFEFDHFYSYSDDRMAYAAGASRHTEAKRRIALVLAEKPHLRPVVSLIANYLNLPDSFFVKD